MHEQSQISEVLDLLDLALQLFRSTLDGTDLQDVRNETLALELHLLKSYSASASIADSAKLRCLRTLSTFTAGSIETQDSVAPLTGDEDSVFWNSLYRKYG